MLEGTTDRLDYIQPCALEASRYLGSRNTSMLMPLVTMHMYILENFRGLLPCVPDKWLR